MEFIPSTVLRNSWLPDCCAIHAYRKGVLVTWKPDFMQDHLPYISWFLFCFILTCEFLLAFGSSIKKVFRNETDLGFSGTGGVNVWVLYFLRAYIQEYLGILRKKINSPIFIHEIPNWCQVKVHIRKAYMKSCEHGQGKSIFLVIFWLCDVNYECDMEFKPEN